MSDECALSTRPSWICAQLAGIRILRIDTLVSSFGAKAGGLKFRHVLDLD